MKNSSSTRETTKTEAMENLELKKKKSEMKKFERLHSRLDAGKGKKKGLEN